VFETLWDLAHKIYDVQGIIRWGGLAIITAIIFSETGLMIGFFLPGDSLLVTAGLFAAMGELNIWWLLALASAAAVAGDATGYWIGYKVGKPLYRRKQTFFFRRDHLVKTREFYERHGGKTIVIARFVPIVRTFAPVVAGVAQMSYARFFSFNVWGGIGWVFSMSLLGFFLGRAFPGILKHVEVVIVVVIAISLLPGIIEYLRHRGKK
jgi:membrane-associated protein